MARTLVFVGRWLIFLLGIWLLSVSVTLAKPTSPDQAHQLVTNWLARNPRPLKTVLGQQVKRVQPFQDAAGNDLYYVVYLDPQGFVIVPANDLVEPVIAFAPSGHFDPSEDNPLGALVSRDVPQRVRQARQAEDQALAEGVPYTPRGKKQEARHKWRDLERKPLTALELSLAGLPTVSDVRVAPLVQSRWSQDGVGETYCYDYFTPNHYVCGCVATAMAQIMRYHQWPLSGVGTPSFAISINGSLATRALRGGERQRRAL